MTAMTVLNVVLWSVQGFLALFFLAAGAPKIVGRGLVVQRENGCARRAAGS